MIKIISKEGYPKGDDILAIINQFRLSKSEGGILIIGKDCIGNEYRPKKEPENIGYYSLPSGKKYRIAVGSDKEKMHPAIHFPFELESRLHYPEILEIENFDDEFYNKFDLTLFNDIDKKKIQLDSEVERIFKDFAILGECELAGIPRNHYWCELYIKRTPALELFLKEYRK